MTEPVDVVRLQSLYDATSPGAWCHMTDESFFGQIRVVDDAGKFELIAETPEHDDQSHNMEFIAESHNAMPALLAELRSLRAAVELERNRDKEHPFNVFKERDELQQSLDNSIAEERRLRLCHQQEFSRAEIAEQQLDEKNAEIERLRERLSRQIAISEGESDSDLKMIGQLLEENRCLRRELARRQERDMPDNFYEAERQGGPL